MPKTAPIESKSEKKGAPVYKYKIADQINKIPREISITFIAEKLRDIYGISQATFMRDRLSVVGDDHVIPTDRLEIYTLLFLSADASPDELKNYPRLKGKNIVELFNESK